MVTRESIHAFHETSELRLVADPGTGLGDHGDQQLRHGRSPGAGQHGEEAFDLIEHFDKSHCADKYHDDDFVTAILRQVRVTCATCVT